MAEIMTRREAAERGLYKYSTGRSCVRGHQTLRYTRTGACIACVSTYSKRIPQIQKAVILAQRKGLESVNYQICPAQKGALDALIAAFKELKEPSQQQLLGYAEALKMARDLTA